LSCRGARRNRPARPAARSCTEFARFASACITWNFAWPIAISSAGGRSAARATPRTSSCCTSGRGDLEVDVVAEPGRRAGEQRQVAARAWGSLSIVAW
jgi:hypothetical protein